MAITLRWTYGQLTNVQQCRIERSSGGTQPWTWTEIAKVAFPAVEYVDLNGSEDFYYRFIVDFFVPIKAESTTFTTTLEKLTKNRIITAVLSLGATTFADPMDYTIDLATGEITRPVTSTMPTDQNIDVTGTYEEFLAPVFLSFNLDTKNVGYTNIIQYKVTSLDESIEFEESIDYTINKTTGDITKISSGSIKPCDTVKVTSLSKTSPFNETIIFSGPAELKYFPVAEGSEVVKKDLVTFIKGTDYTIDYNTGKITIIPTGGILDTDTLSVTYNYLLTSDPTHSKRAVVPDTCRLFGYITNAGGFPVESEKIYIKTYNPFQAIKPMSLDLLPIVVRTQADGYFELHLLKKAVVNIKCQRIGIDHDLVVPEVDEKDFIEWVNESAQ